MSRARLPLLTALLLAACAPAVLGPADPGSTDALLRAVAAAALDSLRPSELRTIPWDVRAEPAGSRGTAALRAAWLHGAGARLRTAADTVWFRLSVDAITMGQDSAIVALDRGFWRCTAQFGPFAGGVTYRLTFVREAGRWHLRRWQPEMAYSPAGPRDPAEGPFACAAA